MTDQPERVLDYNQQSHKTFLVFESALLLLFAVCRVCRASTANITKTIQGTFLKITQKCTKCHHIYVWESQPFFGNIPAGNILTSAAILFTGLTPTKVLRMFRMGLNCNTITSRTFFRHQATILHPAISHVWNTKQQSLIASIKSKNHHLILSGDGRADSPGHSAKYGSYTVMDMTLNKVIDFKLVQVSNVYFSGT